MKKPVFRPVEVRDLEKICVFPADEIELFSSFPAAEYPLTIEQLRHTVKKRMASSVLCLDDEAIAYSNLYDYKNGEYCFIGNVFVSPGFRGQGLGERLVRLMMRMAFDTYGFQSVRVSCFKFNEKALRLYKKIGFEEYDIEVRQNPHGKDVELFHMQYDLFRYVREFKQGLFND